MKPKNLVFPLSLVLACSAMAGQFIWTGATDSTWTTPSNWDITSSVPTSPDTYPIPGSTYLSDFLNIRNNGDLLSPTFGSTPGFAAVYNPGAGVTTTFNGGRCFVVGTGAVGTNGSATLEVRSGTIAAVRTANVGSEPYMANRANTLLWINGGAVDLTGSANNFRLIHEGQLGMTSTITIDSGTLSCNLLDLLFDTEIDPTTVFGTGIINLNGGVLALTRFGRTAASSPGQTSFTLNLNGGTLRCRNANANFLPVLTDLQVLVKAGGAVIDTATFSSTVAAPLLHDPALGATLDGGLTKSSTGTLTLAGASSYTGDTTITGGTLAANDASAVGTGTVKLQGGSLSFLTANGATVSNPINVTTAGTITVASRATTLSGLVTVSANTTFVGSGTDVPFFNQITQTGGITSPNNSNISITASNAGNHVFSGPISLGSGSITRPSGNAALTLSNAANSFSGGLNLAASPSGTFTGVTTITNNGAQGSGNITFTGGTAGIVFSNTSGIVANNILSTGGTGGVTKSGASTLTLTGTSNYTGETKVSGGILASRNASAFGTSTVNLAGGGLQFDTTNPMTVSNPINVTNPAVISVASVATTLSGLTTLSANATFQGSGASGSNINKITQTGGITSANNSSLTIAVSNAETHTFSGAISLGTGSVTRTGNALCILSNAANSFSGGLNINTTTPGFGGITRIDAAGAQGSGAISFTGGDGGISFANVSGTIANNILAAGGTGGVSKSGASTTVLSGANTYAGDTTVSAGILSLTNAPDPLNANSGNDASTVTIATSGATLDLSYAGTDKVAKLFIGAVQQPAGVYGKVGSISPIIGTSKITGTGTLTVSSSPPGGYSAWQTANGTVQTIELDHDNDGVSNGVEYFLGGNSNTTGFTALPGTLDTSGTLSVTWIKSGSYTGTYGTDYMVETSSTLTGWTAVTPPTVLVPQPAGTVKITGNDVKYVFPAGTKSFARLKVTGP